MKNWARKNLKHYLMLLPFFFFFVVFFLYPIGRGLVISFYKWDGVNPGVFVGFNNYAQSVEVQRFYNLIYKYY